MDGVFVCGIRNIRRDVAFRRIAASNNQRGGLMKVRFVGGITPLFLGLVIVAGTLALGQVLKSFAGVTTVGRIWEIGKMQSQRSGHTATLLRDGRVLIAGGMILNQQFLSTAEIYDPATHKFSYTGRMAKARVGHASVLLNDGKVLIVGGWIGGGATDTAEIYDPVSNSFRVVQSRMKDKRGQVTATLLADGRVLIVGGADYNVHALNSAEVFDPKTNQFITTGSMRQSRWMHTSSLLASGKVLIAGGADENGKVLASAELYDPKSGSFSAAGEMLSNRCKHTAATLPDGRVILAGGSDEMGWKGNLAHAEIYEPSANRFVAIADMANARFKLPQQAAVLPSGDVLVAGGSENSELFLAESQRFIPVSGTLDAPRHYMTETALKDGSVLMTGGYPNGPGPTDKAWIFKE